MKVQKTVTSIRWRGCTSIYALTKIYKGDKEIEKSSFALAKVEDLLLWKRMLAERW